MPLNKEPEPNALKLGKKTKLLYIESKTLKSARKEKKKL